MALFEYEALTTDGRLMRGTLEAGSREQADELLKEMRLSVSALQKAPRTRPKHSLGRSEFLLFNQQLASITRAGLPLEKSLRELAGEIGSRRLRRLVNEIADELEKGTDLEEAFAARQSHFPALYGRILHAGIQSGRLSEMLTSLNRHLEMSQHTRRIIFEAMCYPLVILALAGVILSGVALFIIPQFKSIFADFGAAMPTITQAMFLMADSVVPFWVAVGCTIAALVLMWSALGSTTTGRRMRETLLLKIPVLGRIHRTGKLARLADAMAVLVAAGCDMPTCLRLGAASAGSEKLKAECERLAQHLEEGHHLAEAGHLTSMLPRLFVYSVQLGAQRNELQDNLYGLAEMYTEQAQVGQARLQAVLLPAMIVGVGGVMALIVLGVFMPLVSLVSSLSG